MPLFVEERGAAMRTGQEIASSSISRKFLPELRRAGPDAGRAATAPSSTGGPTRIQYNQSAGLDRLHPGCRCQSLPGRLRGEKYLEIPLVLRSEADDVGRDQVQRQRRSHPRHFRQVR